MSSIAHARFTTVDVFRAARACGFAAELLPTGDALVETRIVSRNELERIARETSSAADLAELVEDYLAGIVAEESAREPGVNAPWQRVKRELGP